MNVYDIKGNFQINKIFHGLCIILVFVQKKKDLY